MNEVVEAAWNHSPLATVIAKLDACQRCIIKGAKEQDFKSNLIINKTQLDLEKALTSPTPDSALIIASLTSTLSTAYKEEEQFWLQRSRIQWLRKRDKNTGFFHAITRQRVC